MNRSGINSVLRSLRRVSLQASFFDQSVAIRFGLSGSDVEALELLIDTGSVSAGRLSELMGLTTGAVTRLVDRLEQAGYVRRVPDPADRRRVMIEVVPEKVEAVAATMTRLVDKGAAEIGHYSKAELAIIDDFLRRMAAITRTEATALRDAPDHGPEASEHSAPLGGLAQARLLFRSGANELLVRSSSEPGDLYHARFTGSVPHVRLREGVVTIQYKGRWQWEWRNRRADVALNPSIPWDIEVVGGASRLQGKLGTVDLRSFELTGGADQLRLTLGRPSRDVPIRLSGGGNTVRIERPAGTPVRLELTGGAGSVELDRQKLGAVAGHSLLESPGAATASERYRIEIIGGAAKITVIETDA